LCRPFSRPGQSWRATWYVTQLELRSSDLVDEVNATRDPVVVTQKGVARAVLQDLRSWEETQASLAMLELVVQAEHDITSGRTLPHSAVEKRLRRRLLADLGAPVREHGPESEAAA
jgi:prevent-host-death family protein